MNWRFYITGLIIALAFCGTGLDQSTTDPNQEIVVRFSTNSISAVDAKGAICEITAQLNAIGVENVHVSDVVDGKVKVTYFSTLDVIVIKNLLYRHNKLDLSDTAFDDPNDSSDFPFSNNPNTYKFEVIKIQNDIASDFGFQGLLIESKSIGDQYLKPRLSITASEINFNPKDNFHSVDPMIYTNVPVFISHIEHKIPEVRAGPAC